jgi:putative transposase
VAVKDIVPVAGGRFEDALASASPDLLREMIKGFAQRMMDAEVEALCGAAYGEVSPERVNSRNGYRQREWDTRAGTVELAIPKLRQGSYYPEWLLERRRRAGGRWPVSWRPAICWVSARGGWRSWPSRWV